MTPKNSDPSPQGSPPGVPQSEAFASDLLRGHTDTIVLGTLRDAERYGFEIYKTIKEATLYATFRRLVKDGLVDAYWGDETQGGRRKYYRITDAGRAVYTRNVADWNATQRIINTLLNTAPSHTKGTN
jgi:DNA-binding PadR family transcriptional regulator